MTAWVGAFGIAIMGTLVGFAPPTTADHSCVSPMVLDEMCLGGNLGGIVGGPLPDVGKYISSHPGQNPGTPWLAGSLPPAPDLCKGPDNEWKMVYDVTPDRDALAYFVITLEPEGGIGSGPILNGPIFGTLRYHAEVWKCSDKDLINEFKYWGYKTGYSGGSALAGQASLWYYSDAHAENEVQCYYAPELDLGQVACEHWATTPPTYTTAEGYFTAAGQSLLTYQGTASWDATPPGALSVLWVGDFNGFSSLPQGAKVHVYAKMIGLPV